MYDNSLYLLTFLSIAVFSWSILAIIASSFKGRMRALLEKTANIALVISIYLLLAEIMSGGISPISSKAEKALKILISGFLPMALFSLVALYKIRKE